MAHKHNRRRARPRSRQNKNRKDSDSSYGSFSSGLSYDSLSYAPQIVLTPPEYAHASLTSFPFAQPYASPNGSWQQSQYATQHLQQYQHPHQFPPQHPHQRQYHRVHPEFAQLAPKDAINIESQRIKMFGGEPGDDIDLCYKMTEVFEGMEWIER